MIDISFEKFGIDSLDLYEILFEIEEMFDIKFTNKDVYKIHCMRDIFLMLKEVIK